MTDDKQIDRARDPAIIMAKTMWGEARGEGETGMYAVANVILNRVLVAQRQATKNYWWGRDIISVCLKPWQFSCWNHNDPNVKKIRTLNEDDKIFATAVKIARQIISDEHAGARTDITNGADHYHTKSIMPRWAKGRVPCAVIGHHLFYKFIL